VVGTQYPNQSVRLTIVDHPEPTPIRRGRLPASRRAEREEQILTAARDAIVDLGYRRVTMAEIARRAGASKETLHAWFGGKQGLLAAVIARDADASAARVTSALSSADTDPDSARTVLTTYAVGLLTLLTGPSSVALNRAAVTEPELAEILLRAGRHRVGPIVGDYLAALHEAGTIHAPEPGTAFEVLFGLVVRDTQIRVLLGEPSPTPAAISRRAGSAVQQFLALAVPDRA
jgi:AcrR family transcriptional regulator